MTVLKLGNSGNKQLQELALQIFDRKELTGLGEQFNLKKPFKVMWSLETLIEIL